MKKSMKKVFVIILMLLACLGIFRNYCFADAIAPDKFVSQGTEGAPYIPTINNNNLFSNATVAKDHAPDIEMARPFNYTPLIIGIIAAIIVAIAIIVLISGKNNENKNEEKGE